MKTPRFDRAVLLLQGGGAQGACHAGVYEGLAGAGRHHTWVVEVSFGPRLPGWMEPVQVLPGVRIHDLPRPMASGAMQQVGVQGSAHEPPAQ